MPLEKANPLGAARFGLGKASEAFRVNSAESTPDAVHFGKGDDKKKKDEDKEGHGILAVAGKAVDLAGKVLVWPFSGGPIRALGSAIGLGLLVNTVGAPPGPNNPGINIIVNLENDSSGTSLGEGSRPADGTAALPAQKNREPADLIPISVPPQGNWVGNYDVIRFELLQKGADLDRARYDEIERRMPRQHTAIFWAAVMLNAPESLVHGFEYSAKDLRLAKASQQPHTLEEAAKVFDRLARAEHGNGLLYSDLFANPALGQWYLYLSGDPRYSRPAE
jgi:hypothetical protein